MASLKDLAQRIKQSLDEDLLSKTRQAGQRFNNWQVSVPTPVANSVNNFVYGQPGQTINRAFNAVPQAALASANYLGDIGKQVITPVANTMINGINSFNQIGNSKFNPAVLAASQIPQFRNTPTAQPTAKDFLNVGKAGLVGTGAIVGPAFGAGSAAFGGTIQAGQNIINRRPLIENVASAAGEGLNSGLMAAPVVGATNPLLNKLISPVAGKFTPRLAAGVANAAQGTLISASQGNPITPQGLALDLATGALGGKGQFGKIEVNKNNLFGRERELQLNADELVKFEKILQNKKAYTPAQVEEAIQGVYALGDRHLPPAVKDKLVGKPQQILKAVMKELDKPKPQVYPTEWTKNSFMGFASGSTGKPKGQQNLNRLNIEGDAAKELQNIESQVKPTVIGNKEVVKSAEVTSGARRPITDQQMKELMAKQLKNRQQVVDLTKKFNKAKASGADEKELAKILLELSSQSKTARQGGTLAGRLLQAQNIMADQSAPPMQKIFAMLDNAGVDEAKYIKAAVGVNWDNPTEVVKFYRSFVPPQFGELLTEFRYTNMLSSPLTHITNIVGNALQTGVVTPVEKTISGALDMGKTIITGKERQYYMRSGLDYSAGFAKSLPSAIKKAWGVLSGKDISIRPDYEYMPTGVGGPFQAYTAPLRALEAMDQFFKTLVEGGVTNELKNGPIGLGTTQISDMAQKEANYRLFRQSFDPNGELGSGVVLRTFDKWNSAINNLRRLPGGKWVLPFLQTPTNILKQGVEYSPLGFSTAIGAKAPIEQLSKAIIGTGVFASAYGLAKSGLLSWDTPTDKSERELYYAAGMQPYSVKIGNNWVSYSKLGPLAYPLAMAAALAHSEKYNPDESTISNVSDVVGGMLKFFGDQSYVRSIGDLVESIQGGVNIKTNAISGQAANFAGQLVPYKSFLTWIGRVLDPVYRQANTFGERMIKDMPLLSNKLEPYTDINGQPSVKDHPILNAVLPFKISTEKSEPRQLFNQQQTIKIQKDVEKRQDNKFMESAKNGKGVQSGRQYRYIDENGSLKKIDLDWAPPTLKLTGNTLLDKKAKSEYNGELTKRANDIYKLYEQGVYTEKQAEAELSKLADLKSGSSKGVRVSRRGVNYSTPKLTKSSTPKLQNFRIAKAPAVKMSKPKNISIKTGNISGSSVPAIKVKSFRNSLTENKNRLA